MTTFVWIDRRGQRHELNGPAPIEAEAGAAAAEMDGYVAVLDNPDRVLRDTARAAIIRLQPRLKRLHDDLVRWNDHAVASIRVEAAVLIEQIDKLPAMIADIQLVVDLHGEQVQFLAVTADAPDIATRLLAKPMTPIQRRTIEACRSRDAPVAPTRGEAKAWLDQQRRFARGGQVDGGWFAWIDRNGHTHRLSDPLMIEREIAAIGKGLAGLRPALTANADSAALFAAVDAGFASWARLSILQEDLERYDREATAREYTAWATYAADWRSKRKTT